MKCRDVSTRVISGIGEVTLDPVVISVLFQLILFIAKECITRWSADEINIQSTSLNWFARLLLKRKLRQLFLNETSISRPQRIELHKKYSDKIIDEVFKIGKNITQSDLKGFADE